LPLAELLQNRLNLFKILHATVDHDQVGAIEASDVVGTHATALDDALEAIG
jgi:hypothetical protein